EAFAAAHGFAESPDIDEINAWRNVATEYVLRRAHGDALLWVILLPLPKVAPDGAIAVSHQEVVRRLDLRTDLTFGAIALFADGTFEERDEASRLASGAFMRHAAAPDLEVILMSFPQPNRRPGSNAIDMHE